MENERCPTCNHALHEPDKCAQCNCGESEICHGDLPGEGMAKARMIMGHPLSGLSHVVPVRRKRYED
jgi:hypothetical protein